MLLDHHLGEIRARQRRPILRVVRRWALRAAAAELRHHLLQRGAVLPVARRSRLAGAAAGERP